MQHGILDWILGQDKIILKNWGNPNKLCSLIHSIVSIYEFLSLDHIL